MSSIEKNTFREMRRAIKNGNLELVKNLLVNNEGLLDAMTPFGSWLQVAAAHGKMDIAAYLIEQGINVNARGGMTDDNAIGNAAFRGHLDMVKFLYQNGVDIDISEASRNPLFPAIYNGHYDVVRFLVEAGIDITASYSIGTLENVDAYEYARQYGQLEIAEYLKKKREERQG